MIDILIQKSVSEALNKEFGVAVAPETIALTATKKEFTGDFTLVVFPYMQKCGCKNPVDLANKIGDFVVAACEWVESYNVIKGFLNFVVGENYWKNFLERNFRNETFGYRTVRSDKPVVIEYSSPNTNKPLHLGHIRNNLLGWSVAEILKANGYAVKKVNLVNDRGIHICKSMLAWKKFSGGETPQSSGMKGDHLVGKYYVAFDKAYKKEVADLLAKGMAEEEAERNAPILLEAQNMLKKWAGMDYAGIIDRVYRQPLANRFLASISTFVGELLQGKADTKVGLTDEEYKLLKEMLVQVFRDFVSHILCSYSLAEDAVGFVGSIAFYFQKFILAAMEETGMKMGVIMRSPMEGLIRYHSCNSPKS